MEISEKSNFRFKALVIGLIATILTSTCGTVFGFSLFNLKPADEPFLNRKVHFTGQTYWRSDGQGRKISLFRRGEVIRKDYGEGEGCGIITIVEARNVPYPYYVTGEGWISKEQIVDATRYITLDFNKVEGVENGFGINAYLHVDGEYVEIVSDNDAVVRFDAENKTLVAEAAGSTTVTIHPGEDKEDIKLLAVVVGDENKENGLKLELNIPEKKVTADLQQATIGIWNDKVTVDASGHAEAGIMIEDGVVSLYAEGNGEATLNVNDKEIAKLEANGRLDVAADIQNMTLSADVEAAQKLTILEKLTIGLREKAHAEIDKEHIEADGDVAVDVNDQEIAGASGKINYNFGDEDPTGQAGIRVLGNEVYNTGEKPIRIISGLKALAGQIR